MPGKHTTNSTNKPLATICFLLYSVPLLCLCLVPVSCGRQDATRIEGPVAYFLEKPDANSWDVLCSSGKDSVGRAFAVWFMELDLHRIRRDLPNSMAIEGISPNQKVAAEHDRVCELLAAPPQMTRKKRILLLAAMRKQRFDDSYAATAAEALHYYGED